MCRADAWKSPKHLCPLIDAQKDAVGGPGIVGGDVTPDVAQIGFCATGDKEFSHAGGGAP